MFTYADKTFFKFLAGFVVILAVSFGIIILTGYYEERSLRNNASVVNIGEEVSDEAVSLKEFAADTDADTDADASAAAGSAATDDTCLTDQNC